MRTRTNVWLSAAVTNTRVRSHGTCVLRSMTGSQNPFTVSTASVSGVTSIKSGGGGAVRWTGTGSKPPNAGGGSPGVSSTPKGEGAGTCCTGAVRCGTKSSGGACAVNPGGTGSAYGGKGAGGTG